MHLNDTCVVKIKFNVVVSWCIGFKYLKAYILERLKTEILSLSVRQFIKACKNYHNGGSIDSVLNTLSRRNDIVPTFYLKRIKTQKYYYTLYSPEATSSIVKYLKTRKNLKLDDKLFDFTAQTLSNRFQQINDDIVVVLKVSTGFLELIL